jgi:hypothetical protein
LTPTSSKLSVRKLDIEKENKIVVPPRVHSVAPPRISVLTEKGNSMGKINDQLDQTMKDFLRIQNALKACNENKKKFIDEARW